VVVVGGGCGSGCVGGCRCSLNPNPNVGLGYIKGPQAVNLV